MQKQKLKNDEIKNEPIQVKQESKKIRQFNVLVLNPVGTKEIMQKPPVFLNQIGPAIGIPSDITNDDMCSLIYNNVKCDCSKEVFVLIRLHGNNNNYISQSITKGKGYIPHDKLITNTIDALVRKGYERIHILDNSCFSESNQDELPKWVRFDVQTICDCNEGERYVALYTARDKNGAAWDRINGTSYDNIFTNLLETCSKENLCPYCVAENTNIENDHLNIIVEKRRIENIAKLMNIEDNDSDIEVIFENELTINDYDYFGIIDGRFKNMEDVYSIMNYKPEEVLIGEEIKCVSGLHTFNSGFFSL